MMVTEPSGRVTRIEAIGGNPGLGLHRLRLVVELVVASGGRDQEAVLIVTGGQALVQSASSGNRHHLGQLQPVGDRLIGARGGETRGKVALEIELNRERLQALEAVRGGGEFWLRVGLEGLFTWANATQRRFVSLDEATAPVGQSEWARVRQEMGAGRTMLFEIPEPEAAPSAALRRAIEHWREAHDNWLRGEWRDAVGKCRLVLEALPAGPSLPRNPQERNKEQRFEHVRQSLQALCSAAHHTDDVCAQISWERHDAEAVVGMGATLLRLATA